MTRYVIGALIFCGLGFFGYSVWQSNDGKEQERIAQAARRQALKSAVADMAQKVNAVTNWVELLVGDNKRRNSPVLTAELQKLWLANRPILVIGNIGDIALNGDGTYQVTVGYDDPHGLLSWSAIRVRLTCNEAVAVPLIKAVKEKKKNQYSADVAITGIIDRVVTNSERVVTNTEDDVEEETTRGITGVGRCIDAIPLPERISL